MSQLIWQLFSYRLESMNNLQLKFLIIRLKLFIRYKMNKVVKLIQFITQSHFNLFDKYCPI